MGCRENSKFQHQMMQPFGFVEHEQHNSPHCSSYPSSFSFYTPKLCPMFSNIEEFDELKNNARPHEDSSSSSCAKSDTDSCSEGGDGGGGNASSHHEEVSLNELLLDGKAKKKIEQLAALVGVNTSEPVIVLTEVVRVLKVLKKINMY